MMKTILHRGISLLLCGLLLLQMVPSMSIHVHAEEGDVAYHLTTGSAGFSFTEGASYLLIAEGTSPETGGTAYYTLDNYPETTDITEWYVDGSIVVPRDNALAMLTYREGKLYFADGSMLLLQDGNLSVLSPDEIDPNRTYPDILWKLDGTSNSSSGALYSDAETTATYLNYGTDATGATGFYANNEFNYAGYHLYMACIHENTEKISGTPATCMDKGLADYWQCSDCNALFSDEDCTITITSPAEAGELPATGHNFVDGVCENCGCTDYLYAPITSENQLWTLDEDTTYILVADVNGTYYTMGMPPAEMTDSYPGIAYDLVEVSPEADGTISANSLNAAQFQLVETDYGYAIKLPNYWLISTSGASEPWIESYLSGELPAVEKTGGWALEFYDPDAAFTGGVTEMTYAEYLAGETPALFDNLEKGCVFVYNSFENVAPAMRLRDYSNANGRQFYIAMGGTSVEEGATDVQYPLYLYAAFDHTHVMSESIEGIDANAHGIVCTVEGCTYAKDHAEHSLSETWTYVDETVHGKTCSVCGEQITAQHRSVYRDNGDGTHSLSCSLCNPDVEPMVHAWSEWTYNLNSDTHERFCMQCTAHETNDTHTWGKVEYTEVPSCEEGGSAYAACTITSCEATNEVELLATGHNWSQWYTVEEPTTEDPGYQIRYCLNSCESVEDRTLPYLGHVHQLTPVEEQPATCYEQGTAAHYVCDAAGTTIADSGCGGIYKDSTATERLDAEDLILPMLKHEMGQWEYLSDETMPTETEPGTQQRQCLNGCGYFEDRSVPANSHTVHQLRKVEAVAPSCLFDGNIEYYVCDYAEMDETGATIASGCGCMFSDAEGQNRIDEGDEIDPATGHTMGAWTHNEKVHERRCSDCDYSEAVPHIYSIYADNAATETDCQLVCLVCDYIFESDDEYGTHAYGDGIPSDDGLTHEQICGTCGFSMTSEHNFGVWQLAESDTGTDVHICYCAGCGYEKTSAEHIWVAGEGSQPDCTTGGSVVYTCPAEGCGATKTEEIPANGHTEVIDAAVEATCTTTGLTEGKHCSVCNTIITAQETIPALDHNSTEILPGKDPTCTESGMSQGIQCTLCGEVLTAQQEIPALGHEIVTTFEPISPTCETAGWAGSKACTNCNVTFIESTYLPANGHEWSEWIYLQEPTQLQSGTQFRYCRVCGKIEERDCPAHGHIHPTLQKVEGFAATCWSTGQMTYYICPEAEVETDGTGEADYEEGCGCMYLDAEGTQQVTFAELVIPATGKHTLSDEQRIEDENQPNVIQYVRECTVDGCGYSETRRDPADGHNHTMVFVEAADATCFYNGTVAHYTCSTCGCRYEDADGAIRIEDGQQILPILQHQFGGWEESDNGHTRQCELCQHTISVPHSFSPLPGTEEVCAHTCLICNYQQTFGNHSYGETAPCSDRWQHQKTCENCDYMVIENHVFSNWTYGYYKNANVIFPDGTTGGQMVLGHFRSCSCGAQETSVDHIWDEGTEDAHTGHVTHRCLTYIGDGTTFDCGGIKVEYLRCMHTCFVCGKCTAEPVCPDKEPCDCSKPEPLQVIEPTFLTNNLEDPNETYLGDILVKEPGEELDPDATPGQEIPEEYADYSVGIQEIPLNVKDDLTPLSNPYTEYVIQALDGYEPHYLFDIHLLDGHGYISEANGKAQYLIRLYLKPEIVMDLRNGLLRLAHVTENGTSFYGVGEDCIPFYVLDGTRAWFWADTFSPFALVEPEAPYYGREALAQLANKDALLYAYDQIVAGVEVSAAKIQIYPEGTESQVSIAELQMVMDAYTRDHTEHFWLGSKYSISYSKSSGNAKSIKPTYTFIGDELTAAKAEFNSKVDELLNGVSSDQSEYDRQLLLHDRLAAIVTYDDTLSQPHVHDAYGAIVNGLAVCQGYAEAFQYLLRRVGIQSFIVTGYSNNVAHAWNMVRIDGAYYHTDLTWDDSQDKAYHAYFNISDHYITEDHTIYVTAYPMDFCEDMTSNYFKVNQTDLSDEDASNTSIVAEKIKGTGATISFLLTGNTSAMDFKNWFSKNKSSIMKKAELEGVTSISYALLGRETMITFNGVPPHSCKNGVLIAGRSASCTDNGWKDYYQCSCGKLYADEDCTAAISSLTDWKSNTGKLDASHTFGALIAAQPAIHTLGELKAFVAAHYRCTVCKGYFTENKTETTLDNLTGEVPAHIYDNDADTFCNTCGYERTVATPPPAGLSRPFVNTSKGQVSVTLAYAGSVNGKVMVAVFDAAGRMLGISYVDESITIDSTGKSYTVTYDKNGVPYMVKAFLMSSSFVPVITFDPLTIG